MHSQKTKIDKVAKFILGEDCGCEERKQKLNKLFPYKNAHCLVEEEYNYLKQFFSKHKNTLTNIEQKELLKYSIEYSMPKKNHQPVEVV